jgi:ribosomal protein S16
VPKAAADIRDASSESFAAIEARRFRSRAAFVAASILFGFAGLLLVLGVVRVVGRVRKSHAAVEQPLPPAMVLAGCLRALRRVKADAAQDGWSPALARRALASVRLAGAVALERPISQVVAASDAAEREGQLVLRTGTLRPKRAIVSAATTAEVIDRQLGGGRRVPARSRALLEQLRDALRALSVAGYGRNAELDTIALNGALEQGSEAVKQLRFRSWWPMRMADSVARSYFA